MSLPPLQKIDLTINSPVAVYVRATAPACPFIQPGAAAGSLFGCVITPQCLTSADLHPRLFELLIPVIERFRDDRRSLTEKQQRLLLCHTVVMHVPPQLDADMVQSLSWPNWLGWALKQIYTPKEIVFGFVRKDVIEPSLFGRTLPVAPFHALIIRSRVVSSDKRFFTGNQPLMQSMMEADDDGENAHRIFPGEVPDLRDPGAIRSSNYFDRVRAWGQAMLPRA